jgi:cytochrome c oxidase assembly factor CtaG
MGLAASIAVALATLGLYAAGAVRARNWPLSRGLAFGVGVALLSAAPLLGGGSLALHMAEHAAIAALAAPLIVMGSPLALAAETMPAAAKGSLVQIARSRAVARLTAPAVAWALFVAAQWLLHSEPALRAAEAGGLAHVGEHALLVASALAFWVPVLARPPLPRRLGDAGRAAYLFSATPLVDLAALWLMARGESLAGVAMLAGMLPLAIAGVFFLWRWLVAEERRTARLEAPSKAEAYGGARG